MVAPLMIIIAIAVVIINDDGYIQISKVGLHVDACVGEEWIKRNSWTLFAEK